MKNLIILISLLSLASLLFGCTSGSGLMTLDKNTQLNDTNLIDSNTNIYNNLDSFKKVKIGDTIDVHYVLRLEDGTLVESSYNSGKTLNIVVGKTSLIKGFENALPGMKVGEKKMVTIPPAQAYGEYDSNLVKVFDLNSPQLSGLSELRVGMELSSGSGIVRVVAVTDTNVSIDFNPKLAGKTLIFEITLISIN